jgi:hypothetical protein
LEPAPGGVVIGGCAGGVGHGDGSEKGKLPIFRDKV